MDDGGQLNVARQKFSGFLSPAQLEYKIHEYSSRAEKSYDSKKGGYSSHLAQNLNKLNRDVHNSMNNLGISENNGLSIHKMKKAHDEFNMMHDRNPTSTELSKATGIKESFVSKYQDTLGQSVAISREQHVAPDDIKMKNFSSGLSLDEKKMVGSSTPPKGMARSSFFKKMKGVKSKVQSNYLAQATRTLYDS